jgi:hypothetical protein
LQQAHARQSFSSRSQEKISKFASQLDRGTGVGQPALVDGVTVLVGVQPHSVDVRVGIGGVGVSTVAVVVGVLVVVAVSTVRVSVGVGVGSSQREVSPLHSYGNGKAASWALHSRPKLGLVSRQ